MLTGEQYRASLDDGRATYFEGERIDDIPNHPILGVACNVAADCYDRFYAPEADARSPLMGTPKSAQELKDRIPLLHNADMLAHVTYSSIMTLITAAGRMPDMPVYNARIMAYVEEMQAKDLRITQCITDAKGDRSLPPGKQPDPDSYCRVVERRADGVVIRGAKLHITGASLGHELLTIPAKSMKPGEEDYAIACCMRVNAPGVKIVNTSYAPVMPIPGISRSRRPIIAPRALSYSTMTSCPMNVFSWMGKSNTPPPSRTHWACGNAWAAWPFWPTARTFWSATRN